MRTAESGESSRTALLTAEQQEFAEVLGRLLAEEWDMRHHGSPAESVVRAGKLEARPEKKFGDD